MSDLQSPARPEAPVSQNNWQVWVDTGGTFTDCVGVAPAGELRRAKVLSSSCLRSVVEECPTPRFLRLAIDWALPDGFFRGATLRPLGERGAGVPIVDSRASQRLVELEAEPPWSTLSNTNIEILTGVEAPVLAAHWVTRTPLAESLPAISMRLATTRGTNALLERRGSPTALFTTRGFADLLRIGNQQRPDLFSLAVESREPLYATVVEVEERLAADGKVVQPVDLEALQARAVEVLGQGIEVAAIALLHSFQQPWHEEILARFLIDLGFSHVSCSSALAPRIKIVPRAETAVVNAYLAQVIGAYLERVGGSVKGGPLHVLTSSGGLVRDRDFLPKDSLLSGPAGGVVGAAAMALRSGFHRSLAFDMGGTSTDVSRFDGEFDYQFETRVGDAHLLTPSLAIETVAAGGGSICHFEGRQLKVGPQSAGADPGPACYGAGGPLTLTDVNLLLGRLEPESFEIPIEPAAAATAAELLLASVEGAHAEGLEADELLQGLLDIANERMAEAVRRISIRQGYRTSEYAIVAFGGAGGQHACALAEILDIDTVLVPHDAGLLSAVGLGKARIERLVERQILKSLKDVGGELAGLVEKLEGSAREAVIDEGVDPGVVETRRRMVNLRLEGQEASLTIDYEEDRDLETAFGEAYEDFYGYRPARPSIEIESLRVVVATRQDSSANESEAEVSRELPVSASQRCYLEGDWNEVPVYQRSNLRPGDCFSGAALVFERHCATFVHPGWRGRMDAFECLVLERTGQSRPTTAPLDGDVVG